MSAKLAKRLRIVKYEQEYVESAQKVRYCHVKVRLHSMELVRSRKACFNRTYNVPSNVQNFFFLRLL